MKQHVTIVATLQIVFGVLKLLLAAIIFLVFAAGGLISGDLQAMAIISTVGLIVVVFLVALALPGIVGGIGLLKGKSWARLLVLVLAVLDLLDFPLGTAVSIYTIWVLLNGETSALFNGKSLNDAEVAPAY
jgi:hypothetical protein